jgi:hypothetical protein
MGEVSQVVNGGSILLQGFPDELGPLFQLRLEHCFQVMVTVAIFKRLSNLFVRRSGRDAM